MYIPYCASNRLKAKGAGDESRWHLPLNQILRGSYSWARVTIAQPEHDLARDVHILGFIPVCESTCGDTRKAKLSAYTTRSRSKVMEDKVGALELQNQDLNGEVSQLKEQMAQMSQILSQTNITIMAMAQQHAACQEQKQAKAEAQHQASWTIPSFAVHQQMP
ncbi:hypothetical protein CR513_19656, partial [Mucuna pruriens]